MTLLRQLLREPLVHFSVVGGVLFGAFCMLQGPDASRADDGTIVVDRRTLLTYMQVRANAFEPNTFAAALDAMPQEEVQALIDAYVDEEVLYREAKTLGLETSDYVIRDRMVQKIKFLLSDVASVGATIDEEALVEYFVTHRDSYAVEPAVTFTHVFFDVERRGMDHAGAAATQALHELRVARAAFNDASGRGDPFPFLRNYVERTFDYVTSHFGADFAAALAAMPANGKWQGPIRSAYGLHVVLLMRRTERSYPNLHDVREDVERDYLGDRSEAAVAAMTRTVRERYRVEISGIRAEDGE